MKPLSFALLASLLHPVVTAPTPEPKPAPLELTPAVLVSMAAFAVTCTNMIHNLGRGQCDNVKDAQKLSTSMVESTIAKIRRLEPQSQEANALDEQLREIKRGMAKAGLENSGPPFAPYKGKLVSSYKDYCGQVTCLNEYAEQELYRAQFRMQGKGAFLPEQSAQPDLELGLGTPSSSGYLTPNSRPSSTSSSGSSGGSTEARLTAVSRKAGSFTWPGQGSRAQPSSLLPTRK
ncbi:hypothetical protein PspLS_01732 [Pyricularia sp. CBS 133598]|nr:hypothetical protein PspLS_01732 [Pyricularia sp. CBS 133598]